jgi:hypothetical protein
MLPHALGSESLCRGRNPPPAGRPFGTPSVVQGKMNRKAPCITVAKRGGSGGETASKLHARRGLGSSGRGPAGACAQEELNIGSLSSMSPPLRRNRTVFVLDIENEARRCSTRTRAYDQLAEFWDFSLILCRTAEGFGSARGTFWVALVSCGGVSSIGVTSGTSPSRLAWGARCPLRRR